MKTIKELEHELSINLTRYINKEIQVEQLLGDCKQDVAMCQELNKNRAQGIIRDLEKKVGSTIVAEMLRYIL
jgi:hypothetical protein